MPLGRISKQKNKINFFKACAYEDSYAQAIYVTVTYNPLLYTHLKCIFTL